MGHCPPPPVPLELLEARALKKSEYLKIIRKMFCRWFSTQIFAWTIMIIEYPMIRFLAMHYFFVHALNVQIISKLLVAMH